MRANLKQSGQSIHFWCWAVQHADGLSIDHLVPFGCIGVSFIPDKKRRATTTAEGNPRREGAPNESYVLSRA